MMDSTGSRSEWASGAAAAATGLGILTFALFPFAVPFLLLAVVALLPLALPLIALAAVAAILLGAWIGLRAVGRGIRRLQRGPERSGVTRAQREAVAQDGAHRASGDATPTGLLP